VGPYILPPEIWDGRKLEKLCAVFAWFRNELELLFWEKFLRALRKTPQLRAGSAKLSLNHLSADEKGRRQIAIQTVEYFH
jgi:hypothetical protein